MSRLQWAAVVVMLLGSGMLVAGVGLLGAWIIVIGIVMVAIDRWRAEPHAH